MGYGGFGLQKWIYKQKARKPFTRSRNGVAGNSEFSNNFNASFGAYEKDEALANISNRRKFDLLTLFAIIIALVGLGYYFSIRFSNYEVLNKKSQLESKVAFENKSYEILINQGTVYYNEGNYSEASKELELAYNIKQTKQLKYKLLVCYQELCEAKNNEYCRKYEEFKVR